MRKILFISLIILVSAGGLKSLQPEDLFTADIYLAGTNRGLLIFRQSNSVKVNGKFTVLTHTYTKPDGTTAVKEETALFDRAFHKYQVEFSGSTCGCLLERNGSRVRFGFTRGDVNKKGEDEYVPSLVTGPTLTPYIRTRWSSLIKGETVFIHFPAMTLQRIVRFRIVKSDSSVYARSGVLVLKMDAANPFIRIFVDPVDLVYDLKTRRIMEIHGKSLLEREVNGKIENPVVDIYYKYK
jgi:hypothetical protein